MRQQVVAAERVVVGCGQHVFIQWMCSCGHQGTTVRKPLQFFRLRQMVAWTGAVAVGLKRAWNCCLESRRQEKGDQKGPGMAILLEN